MNIDRFLLAATIVLAMIFTYSCSSEDEKGKDYYAIIARTGGISYTSLYPNVSMEPEGYFLNEMAQYVSGGQYEEDICSRIVVCTSLEAVSIGFRSAEDCCRSRLIKEHPAFGGVAAMRDWLKSADTPFYNDINSEIFIEGNSKFLGFYRADGEELYIFVSEM